MRRQHNELSSQCGGSGCPNLKEGSTISNSVLLKMLRTTLEPLVICYRRSSLPAPRSQLPSKKEPEAFIKALEARQELIRITDCSEVG